MKSNEKSITVTVTACDGQEVAKTEFYISIAGCKKTDTSPRKLVLDKTLKAMEQVAHQINMDL